MEYRSLCISIAVFVILTACEIIVYGFFAGISEINETALEKEIEDGNKKAKRILKLKNKPFRLYASCGFISTLSGVLSGALIIKELIAFMEVSITLSEASLWIKWILIIVLILITVVILLCFGILVPRKLAFSKPEKWVYRFQPFMTFILTVTYPLILLTEGISNLAVRIFGIDPHADTDMVTEEEIVSMVNEGHEQGIINSDEAEMINNIMDFSDKEAGDIMIHRANVVAFDCDMKLCDAIDMILKEGYSRIPVYREIIDDVIGIFHLKDAIIFSRDNKFLEKPIGEIDGLLRPPVFIPETRNISSLLKNMQDRTIHQVIVVDEYGQMAGILTMEDILEEIVGNIFDEYDENEKLITETENGYIMSGMTPLDEVFEALGYDEDMAEELDYDTLNGFLIYLLDRIPEENEKPTVLYKEYTFEVLEVKNKMINTVRLVKHKTAEDKADAE